MAPLAPSLLELFPQGCSPLNLLEILGRCEVIFLDPHWGERMVLKLNVTVVVKIVTKVSGKHEHSTLEYLEKHMSGVPTPKPLGMIELNGRFLTFMS